MNKKLVILFGLLLVAAMLIGASALKNVPNCGGKACTVLCPGKGLPCTGTSGNDVICGSDTRDVIDAKGGNDLVCGWYGNDEIKCGPGNDWCWGGPGNDSIAGGTGNDTIDGGPGWDACADVLGTTYVNCP
jgi:Ca2+-binding RTX toxin-like protein